MTSLDSNVNLFLGIHTQLKIFHWQTKGYARHNAFADTRDTLEGLIDEFVEQAMGKYGRFELTEDSGTIQLSNISELKPESMIDTICNALIQLTDNINPEDTNLLNIRDEMLGAMYKLKYLLTLK